MNPAQFPVFLFIRETGCRLGEALTLRWEDISWQERIIYLDQHKSGQENIAPPKCYVLQALLEGLPPLPGCPFVFYNPRTQDRWKDVRKAWIKARKLIGQEWLEIHDLRRYRATELWELGIAPQVVSSLLGHASIGTIEKHYIQERRRETARKVLEILEPRKKAN